MIPRIKKILYTTDLSDNAAYVFRYAINSAKVHDAHIIILHVVEQIPSSAKALIDSYLSEKIENKIAKDRKSWAMDRIRNRLQVFCEKELKGEPDCADRVEAIEVCQGHPADEILRKSHALSCDAIIMGTHGKGMIANTFLGSTVKKVLRRTRKPVFVIPLPKGEIDITFHDF